jgi:asparagine synthase (glutamine-hydrolysing)
LPGIFGIVDRIASAGQSDPELSETIDRMAAAMRYEPRYASEVVRCPELGIFVGRVGWPVTEMPEAVVGSDTDLFILTAGEPTGTHAHATSHAAPDGVDCRGPGALDIARAWIRAGETGFPDLRGVFAAVIVDRRRNRVVLLNDRYGIERLFVHDDGHRTYFASEAKAILAVAPRTREFDAQGLAELMACGCTLGNRSLFSNIEVLPGGTLLSFGTSGDVRRRTYFDRVTLENSAPLPEGLFLDGLCERLKTSTNASVRRGPRAAISLTGGLDSRMIMASLDAGPGEVPCYTFGSMYRETFDVSIGREIAARCRQPWEVIELGRDFLRGFATMLDHAVFVADGYLGASGAAELYLNRLARSIAPVRVTGNWGGELLRGVRAFKHLNPGGGFLATDLNKHLQRSAEEFADMRGVHPLSFTLFHQAPCQGYGRYAIERSQMVMRSAFMDTDVVDWLYRAPSDPAAAAGGSAARCAQPAASIAGRSRKQNI